MSKLTSKYQLTLPKALAQRAGYKPGDEIECDSAGGVIRIRHKADDSFSQSRSITDRLVLFDLATERQAHRQLSRDRTHDSTRGWTREDLYE